MMSGSSETFAELGIPVNPFPGLRPFEFDESHLFFGRDGQSEQLIGKLGRTRFLAVVGTSGSGKSSLVRAGLLPSLLGGFMSSAGSDWKIAITRPGNDPIGNLAKALNAPDVFGSEVQENAALQTVLADATLQRGSRGLIDVVRQAMISENENLLVVVDQFEEIFRFARVAEGEDYQNEAAAFVKLILEASRQRELPIYVVLTMRSDYLGDCSQFWGLPEAINESQYLIPRLTRDQLREAMIGPINVAQGNITPRLVARLLNDVGDNQDQLPVLQHLLMRVWDECKEKRLEVDVEVNGKPEKKLHKTVHSGDALDLCCYEAVGGMTHALSRHADDAFNELPDERSRKVAEKLFKTLTEKGPDNREIRRPVTLGEICAVVDAGASEVITVVETFRRQGRSFLMPPEGVELNSDSLIDISHESLIRAWERLKKWVDEETRSARIYRRLAETAVLHKEAGAGLWRDPDLQIALTWRDESKPNEVWARRYHSEFDLAMAFLDQSVAERSREMLQKEKEIQHRKSMKRTRWLALVFGSLFVVSAVALFFANVQAVRARAAEKRAQMALITAEEQKRLAEDQTHFAEEQKQRAEKSAAEARELRNSAVLARNKAEAQQRLAEKQASRIAELEKKARREAIEAQEINTLIREVEDELKHGNADGVISKVKKQLEYYRKKHDQRGEYESQSILGPVYLKQGQHDEAQAAAQSALTIQENAQIDDREGEHENLVVLREASLREADLKQGSQAEELRNAFNFAAKVLRVQEGAIGASNPDLIPDLASLAAITARGGQHETSEGFRARIVDIQRKSVQAERSELVAFLNDLATFNRVQGDYDHAVTQLKEVLQIQEDHLPPNDPQIIATLNGLAEIYRLQKKDADAETLVKRIQKLQGNDAILRKGTSGPEVKKLQQQLQALGIFRGTAEEYFGPQTEAAVMEFQTRQGLLADGVAGPRTLELLENPPDKGVSTKQIQTELQKLGFYTGTPDGSFGIRTKAALMSFQRSKGLSENGEPNEETLVALGLKTPANAVSVTGKVTPEIVAKMFPRMPITNLKANLPLILRALEDEGLSDKDMVLMALATIGVDTGDFAPLTERTSRFNTSADGAPFDLYDNRKELGNQGPPDGERFKGRGFAQITGRARYKKFGAAIGVGDQLLEYPDLASQPDIAARIFAASLKEHEVQIRSALKAGDFRLLRKISTGSHFGLDVFTKAFEAGASLIK